MHWRRHHLLILPLAVWSASLFALAACSSSEATPTTTPTIAPNEFVSSPTATPGNSGDVEAPAARQPWPGGQPIEQADWVLARVKALKAIYGFTAAGEEWMDGYDMRQMAGQPAWFGSHGYNLWAGAGEAVPRSVMHEFGHSYWGAFSIEGQPDLLWERDEANTSAALLAYRADLEKFMAQPPDRFEPLRDRFRNMPNLSRGDYSDLYHFGEADMVYMTGGNLDLIPPILRKYFTGYLERDGVGPAGGPGQMTSWDEAIAWFNGLESDERYIAGELFGIQHFPLGMYNGLPSTDFSGLDEDVRTAYEAEERQKLIDFEEQFADIISREFALSDAVGTDRGFDFWRGYLSDKLNLHQRHNDVLRSIGSERADQLADALDYFGSIAGSSPEDQAESFRESQSQPLVSDLAVLLKPRAIVELFSDANASEGVLSALGGRAARLAGLVEAADRVAEASGTSAASGAAEFEAFITGLPEEQLRADIYLLLDLLRSGESGVAASVLPALSDDALSLLLRTAPAAARSPEIGPERLLESVGVNSGSSLEQITAGAKTLANTSSGNFAIDAPYDEAVFSHLDRHVDDDPSGALRAVSESGMRIVPWISRDSDGAIDAMRDAPDAAADLLMGLEGARETPERIIHLLAKRDATLAAELAFAVTERSGDQFLERVVLTFSYDAYWSERASGPNVSPGQVAEFFVELSERIGVDETSELLSVCDALLRANAAAGEIEDTAADEFARTLEAAVDAGNRFESARLGALLAMAQIMA